MTLRIGFIGGGAMGEAIVSAVLKHGIASPSDLVVSDVAEARRELLRAKYGVGATSDNSQAIDGAALILLAVKPQEFSNVAAGLRGKLGGGQTVLSIMAGVPIARIAAELNHEAVVRAMPNTAAFVGEAMSVWMASSAVSEEGRAAAERVLGAMGRQIQVTDEKFLDMTTAVSGSGPGFERPVAEQLALQTLYGSALLARETGKPAAELRAMVTSKGGTTAAGIEVLEKADMQGALRRAVEAAHKRAKELGG